MFCMLLRGLSKHTRTHEKFLDLITDQVHLADLLRPDSNHQFLGESTLTGVTRKNSNAKK